jgi:pyruvate dehydrogenase E2 component (dihydrolipoamide acetyltransferase)
MATEFKMPKLGLTMEAGTILQWLVDDGANVAEGQAVMVIETDKVESEVESSGTGVLHRVGEVGKSYDCGTLVGWFLEPGEVPPSGETTVATATAASPVAAASSPAAIAPASPGARGDGGRVLASPFARRRAAELGVDLTTVAGTGPGRRIVADDVEAAARAPRPLSAPPAGAAPVRAVGSSSTLASFPARALADELGIDLDSVASLSGDARLGRDDVVAHARMIIARSMGATPTPTVQTHAPLLQTPSQVIPLRGMRGTIAARMHESLQQMAQLTLTMDVDMSAVIAHREARTATGAATGFTDYVIAATARALVDHPYANSQITADGVALLPQVNVGMAVALDAGLVVPVVRNTPELTLAELAAETSRLAGAARSGGLKLSDLEGGTFSVTALGMFGVDAFTPVINAPNTAILGVGRLRDETKWNGEQPERTTVLTLSLTWDHRAFDGAPAAEFVRSICRHLEAADF